MFLEKIQIRSEISILPNFSTLADNRTIQNLSSFLHLIMILLSLGLFSSFALISHAIDCFSPNGTNRGPAYQPCNGVSGMCCATNRIGDINTCLPNGLCLAPEEGGITWRESCTDPTWQSKACLKLCINGTISAKLSSLYVLYNCAL